MNLTDRLPVPARLSQLAARRQIVYIAHPLGSGEDRPVNRRRAERWVVWAAENFNVAPVATWTTLALFWQEDRRDLGLAIDRALIEAVVAVGGAVWLTGGRVSPGMSLEARWALDKGAMPTDLTVLGEEPPTYAAMTALYRVSQKILNAVDEEFCREMWRSLPAIWTTSKARWPTLSPRGVEAFYALVRIGFSPAEELSTLASAETPPPKTEE